MWAQGASGQSGVMDTGSAADRPGVGGFPPRMAKKAVVPTGKKLVYRPLYINFLFWGRQRHTSG